MISRSSASAMPLSAVLARSFQRDLGQVAGGQMARPGLVPRRGRNRRSVGLDDRQAAARVPQRRFRARGRSRPESIATRLERGARLADLAPVDTVRHARHGASRRPARGSDARFQQVQAWLKRSAANLRRSWVEVRCVVGAVIGSASVELSWPRRLRQARSSSRSIARRMNRAASALLPPSRSPSSCSSARIRSPRNRSIDGVRTRSPAANAASSRATTSRALSTAWPLAAISSRTSARAASAAGRSCSSPPFQRSA